MRRLIVGLTLSVLFVVVLASPSEAGPAAGAYTDAGGVGSGAASGGSQPGGSGGDGGGGGGGASTCTYQALSPEDSQIADRLEGLRPPGTGAWHRKICIENGISVGTIAWIPQVQVDPAAMAAEALRYLPLPAPTISTSPARSGMLVVRFPTWLWIDPAAWRPQTSTVSVPGVSVTVTAVPERVVWSMGDGTTLPCDGPGTAYNPAIPDHQQSTGCSYIYSRTSARQPGEAFPLAATIEWRATWAAAGAPGGGDLGVVRRSSGPVPVRVGEVQAVNTPLNQRRFAP